MSSTTTTTTTKPTSKITLPTPLTRDTCMHGSNLYSFRTVEAILDDLKLVGSERQVSRAVIKKAKARVLKTSTRMMGAGNEYQVITELNAMAACEILGGDVRAGRGYFLLSEVFKHHVLPSITTTSPEALARIMGVPRVSAIDQIDNARGFVRFVATIIPCDCLDGKHAGMIKKKDNTVFCWNCVGETPIQNVLRCSRCKTTNYCSEACQHANWSEHKQVCKLYQEHFVTPTGVTKKF